MNAVLPLSRRMMLAGVAGAGLSIACRGIVVAAETPRTMGLGFSLYGMKSLAVADALQTCAEIGYDCIELPVMSDWPADSEALSAQARSEIRRQLAASGLRLSAIMENLPALGSEQQHAANLERLNFATQLARDLSPIAANGQQGNRPLIETILGGKPGEFESVKQRLIERLGEWAKIMAEAKVTLAIKAHISNAIQQPAQLVEVLESVASPWLKGAYDYSHFQLQELPLAESMTALLPRSAFIHVKDIQREAGRWKFVLPGEGSIDYGEYFKLLSGSNYRGDVVVEVSGQVFNQLGYDPVAAARKCYNHLAPAMEKGGIRRA